MKKNLNKYTIFSNDNLSEAIKKINSNPCKTLIVIKKNKVLGTFSEGDLVRALVKNTNLFSLVSDHMTTEFKFINKFDKDKIIKFFLKYNISLIPICNKKFELLDIIIVYDFLKKNI